MNAVSLLSRKFQLFKKHNFVKFCVVGFCGLLANLAVFYLSRRYMQVDVNFAATMAFSVAVTQNYYFNHRWTFGAVVKNRPNFFDYARYVLVNIAGLGINLLVLNSILFFIPKFEEIVAQALSILAALVVNYAGSYVFVFAKDSVVSLKVKRIFCGDRWSLIKQMSKREYKIAVLIFFAVFFIFGVGQMIAVVGGRQIIEPFVIHAKNTEGQTPSSFKRFMQLARAGNYTLITAAKSQEDEWKVGGVFVKKIVVVISKTDLHSLHSLDVVIGDKQFTFTKQQFLEEWLIFDTSLIGASLSGEDLNNYIAFEAPVEVSLSKSKIPVYEGFFGSLINWGGDAQLFITPLKKTLFLETLFLGLFFVVRILFLFSKNYKLPASSSEDMILAQKRQFIVFFLSIISSIISLCVLTYVISRVYKPDVAQILQNASSQYVDYFFKSFRPKPVERLQFVTDVFATPFLLLFFYHWFNKKISQTSKVLKRWYLFAVTASVSFIAMVVYWGLAMSGFFYIRDSYYFNDVGKYIFGLLIFPTTLFLFLKNDRITRKIKIILQIMIGSVIVLVFFMNIVNLTDSFSPCDLDPVIYPISQLMAGKSLLVNMTSFYGLYPFFLTPIFKVVGLSVLKFSFVMGLLVVVSLLCLWGTMCNVIKNKGLLFLGFLFTVFYSLFATRVSLEYYFQYWPIRFLFPCLGLFLMSIYFKKESRSLYYFSFLVYSIGVFWNFDVGVVMFLSWFILLVYHELSKRHPRRILTIKILKHLFVATVTFFFVVCYFVLRTYVVSGRIPDFILFFQYQKIFLSGYLMIKMLLPPHTWNIIILVYLVGLLISAKAFYLEKIEYIEKIIFLLSVVGIGLFAYYEGQSSDVTLFRTSYPALILMVIFADCLWERIKKYGFQIYGEVIIFVFLLFVISSTPFSFVFNGGTYFNFVKAAETNIRLRSSVMFENIDFIKKHTYFGEGIFILTYPEQGVYYTESKTHSIIDVTSIIDIPLPKEMDVVVDFLNDNKNVQIFVQQPLEKYDTLDIRIKRILQEKYQEVERNKNNMVLYRVK
jgi:putative flippase GtrA